MTTEEMRALGIAASKYDDASLAFAIQAAEATDRKLAELRQAITNRLYVLRGEQTARQDEPVLHTRHGQDHTALTVALAQRGKNKDEE